MSHAARITSNREFANQQSKNQKPAALCSMRWLHIMGYDLTPRNKKAGDYHIGAFSWPMMLDAGLGLVLGTAPGFKPAEFIYLSRPDNLCVQYNDGARVTAAECKDLAKVARWIAAVQEGRIRQWEKVPDEEKDRMKAANKRLESEGRSALYKLPWHPDVVKSFRDFADWCEKSRGFKIH